MPGVRVHTQDNTNTLFDIDRNTNSVRVGTCDKTNLSGIVKIGGNDLELYSSSTFKLKTSSQTNTISICSSNFYISNSGNEIKIPYGMQFENDGINLIIKKLGDPTKKVKIQMGNTLNFIFHFKLLL
jgi:hypothetical protein